MRNLLGAMDAAGVKQIVFTSSVAIYGMNQPEPPKETSIGRLLITTDKASGLSGPRKVGQVALPT
jgi:nucleoside-diphosphate-sugar epimerase